MIQYRRELYKLLPPDFVSAECGVAEFFFSEDILKMGASLHYAIDNWGTLDQKGDGGHPTEWHEMNFARVQERAALYGDRVKILRGLSAHMAHEIPDNSLDLCYIDCDHSYTGVRDDINSYWIKLKSGGVMAFHDYQAPQYGVMAAVLEFAARNNLTVHDIPEDKPEDAGAYIVKP